MIMKDGKLGIPLIVIKLDSFLPDALDKFLLLVRGWDRARPDSKVAASTGRHGLAETFIMGWIYRYCVSPARPSFKRLGSYRREAGG